MTDGQGNNSVEGRVVLVAEHEQSRGGEEETRQSHKLKIAGSNPAPATSFQLGL